MRTQTITASLHDVFDATGSKLGRVRRLAPDSFRALPCSDAKPTEHSTFEAAAHALGDNCASAQPVEEVRSRFSLIEVD